MSEVLFICQIVVPYRYYTSYCVLFKTLVETPFSPILKPFFFITQWNCMAIGLCSMLKIKQWLGSGASGYIMWAFAKTHKIYFLSATTTKSSLYQTRSLHRWTSHRSGSRPHSARPTRRFSAARSACSSWSTDSLSLSGVSLFRELLYKSKFLRRCCKCRTIFVTRAADKHGECVSYLGTTAVTWVSPLCAHG